MRLALLALLLAAASPAAGQPETVLGLVVAPEENCVGVRRGSFRKAVRTKYPPRDGWQIDHRVAWDEALDSGLCHRSREEQFGHGKRADAPGPI